MRHVLNPCTACEDSHSARSLPFTQPLVPTLSSCPLSCTLLLGKGRETRQVVQGCRGGTPARCCGGDAPDPGKAEGGEGDIGVARRMDLWTVWCCGVWIWAKEAAGTKS